jgi:hypothetical protein
MDAVLQRIVGWFADLAALGVMLDFVTLQASPGSNAMTPAKRGT